MILACSAVRFLAFCAGVTTALTAVNTAVATWDHYQRLKPKRQEEKAS
jgi:hypothetical protein